MSVNKKSKTIDKHSFPNYPTNLLELYDTFLSDKSYFEEEDFYSFDETLLKIIHDGLNEWEYKSTNKDKELHEHLQSINKNIEKYLQVMYGSPPSVLNPLLHGIFSELEGTFKGLWY